MKFRRKIHENKCKWNWNRILNNPSFQDDYLSLTDIARKKNPYEPKDVVKNWLRLRSTIEFLGLWEQLYNPNFKGVEFDSFKNESGSNAFTLTPKRWIEKTNAIGIISKSGRGGGIKDSIQNQIEQK